LILAGLIYWYFSRKGKSENIVLYYYERRKASIKMDGILGFFYCLISFILIIAYGIGSYILHNT